MSRWAIISTGDITTYDSSLRHVVNNVDNVTKSIETSPVATPSPQPSGAGTAPSKEEEEGSVGNPILITNESSSFDTTQDLPAVVRYLERSLRSSQDESKALRQKVETGATIQGKLRKDLRSMTRRKEHLYQQKTRLKLQLVEEKQAADRRRQRSECIICRDEPWNTVTLCGHQFCEGCFQRWYQEQHQRSRRHTCPTCRAPLDSGRRKPPMTIKIHSN